MKHLLITGEKQVGKSTLIKSLLRLHPEWRIGGFLTVSRFDEDGLRHIHMIPAVDRDTPLTAENEVGQCDHGSHATGSPEEFNRIGVPLLRNKDCDLLIADEIGHMERNAEGFIEALLKAFEGDVPVLGVIKPVWEHPTPYTERIRSNPNVDIWELTPEKREELLSLAEKRLIQVLKGE